ncbi:MAG: hypothetical protein H6876_08600 [Hyphomicrobiaceae bacterium]|nr:hypothetical protein [Hyphomicrobiaceae bacterium]MCC0008169.1 hypothetical protein [Hyphomicrobiaceae bacterium]
MRIRSFIVALTALAALIVVALPQSASAGFRRHDGWSGERTVTHRVYLPRYRHRYYAYGDPYHYRYVKPRYYPAYDSHYWVPARCYKKCRKHYRLPRYYQAWGYPKYGRKHSRRHHHRHHRRHHHW